MATKARLRWFWWGAIGLAAGVVTCFAFALGSPDDQHTDAPLVGTPGPPPASRPSSEPIDEHQALAVAKQAVEANDTLADRATYDIRRTDDGWSVTVWREPKSPGGHRLVVIDKRGHVTSYIGGR